MTTKNDVEITITKQVEQKEIHTINTITRDIIDLESKWKMLNAEIEKIDIKITELENIKTEVSTELLKL